MTNKERFERIKQYYSCMNVLEPDIQEDIKWLINRVEELEEEIENWRKVKEATVKLLGENKRYKQALEEILNADCNLEGLDAERELDRVTDIAHQALKGEE